MFDKKNQADQKNPAVENLIVHTMKKDLEEEPEILPEPPKKEAIRINVKPEPSPAKKPLFPESPALPKPNFQNFPPRPAAFSEIKPELRITAAEETGNVSPRPATPKVKKILLVVSLVLTVLLFVSGGYYYWLTVKNANPEPQEIIAENVPEEEEAAPVAEIPEKKLPFELRKTNPLSFDPEKSDQKTFLAAAAEKIQLMKDANLSGPIEFQALDLSGQPVKFSVFAAKIGLVFSRNLAAEIKDDFRLFLENDVNGPKISLSLATAPGKTAPIKSLLKKEELTLIPEVSPLFFPENWKDYYKKAAFRDSLYGQTAIRYQNILSPEKLSVDYAVLEGKLLIATSKNSLRSVIDYLAAVSQ